MNLIDKDAVMAEMERLKNKAIRWAECKGGSHYEIGKRDAYNIALCFLDTLEVKEVNIPSNLDDVVEERYPDFSNSIAFTASVNAARDAFKAGAEWMAGQMKQEQPEVDLEKEIDACWQNWLSPSNQKEVEEVLPKIEFAMYARHFWNKGYNARKEE